MDESDGGFQKKKVGKHQKGLLEPSFSWFSPGVGVGLSLQTLDCTSPS